MGFDLNLRYSYRSAQPLSLGVSGQPANTPQDRCLPVAATALPCSGGAITRNLGRKDNKFSALDFRLSKQFHVGGVIAEPAVDVFNALNSKNFVRPEVTSLIFNFDGTVRSGAGDPRQVQLALRVLW